MLHHAADYISSIISVITITITINSTTSLPHAVSIGDLHSLPECGKMGLQKQGGNREEGLEDKNTKEENSFCFIKKHSQRPRGNGPRILGYSLVRVYLLILKLSLFHEKSRGTNLWHWSHGEFPEQGLPTPTPVHRERPPKLENKTEENKWWMFYHKEWKPLYNQNHQD